MPKKVPNGRFSGFKSALNPFNPSFEVWDIDNSVDVCQIQLDPRISHSRPQLSIGFSSVCEFLSLMHPCLKFLKFLKFSYFSPSLMLNSEGWQDLLARGQAQP